MLTDDYILALVAHSADESQYGATTWNASNLTQKNKTYHAEHPKGRNSSCLHPAASLASPRCGAIRDAEERPEPETPRQHAVHVLPVDGKRIPFGEVERTMVRTKPYIIHSSQLCVFLTQLYIPSQAGNSES